MLRRSATACRCSTAAATIAWIRLPISGSTGTDRAFPRRHLGAQQPVGDLPADRGGHDRRAGAEHAQEDNEQMVLSSLARQNAEYKSTGSSGKGQKCQSGEFNLICLGCHLRYLPSGN